MYYELYIDSFFLLNLFMDTVLLLMVRKILKCTATHFRILLSAAFGAAMACLITVAPYIPGFLKLIAGYGLVSICMVKISFHLKDLRTVLKGTVYLYAAAFFMGGFVQLLTVQVPFFRQKGWNIMSLSMAGYLLYAVFSWAQERWGKGKSGLFRVKLVLRGEEETLTALLDTGNSLIEPIGRKPVSVVESRCVEKLLRGKREEEFRVIPYHSVGKKHGVLQGYEITKMIVYGENEEIVIEKPVLGLMDGELSSGGLQYQMILNPILIKE